MWPKLKSVQRTRPDQQIIEAMYDFYTKYWETLIKVVPEYKTVLKDETKSSSYYRQPKRNHLLFRPVGQLAFARAVNCLIARDFSLEVAVKHLYSKNKMHLQEKVWHHILWDPVAEKMLNNWSPAETLLLRKAARRRTTISCST